MIPEGFLVLLNRTPDELGSRLLDGPGNDEVHNLALEVVARAASWRY